MRPFGLVPLALLIANLAACSARPARLPLAEPQLEMSADAPEPAGPPVHGIHESEASRAVRIVVTVGEREVALWSWCRVGVWTTLQELRPERFIARESWGRLGERKPKRLARIHDEALGGVVARLRPNRDGGLSFVVEVSAVDPGKPQPAGKFFDEEIELGHPKRHGYRFTGRAPKGWTRPLARWGDVTVRLEGTDEPAGKGGRGTGGMVAGREASAEAFIEEWVPARPVHVHLDGVMRADFRVEKKRSASGFRPDGKDWYNTYGAAFDLSFDSGAVRFDVRR